jgi:hypothetical protein
LETKRSSDQVKYPNQKIYFVIVNEYIYLVPYIQSESEIFLKTIIPSRKTMSEYKKEINNEEIK